MTIYRLSLVERNHSYGHPQAKIVDFKTDYEFKKFNSLKSKLKQLLRQGYNIDVIDITTWDRNGQDYNIISDPFNSLSRLISEVSKP